MRKIYIFVLTLITIASLSAQTLTQYPQSKDFNYLKAAYTTFVGEDAQSIYLATYATKSFLGNYKTSDIMVAAVDHNLKEQRTFKFEDTDDHTIVAAAMNGEEVIVLAYLFDDNKLTLTRFRVNVTTMKLAAQPENLLTLSGKNCYTWYKWSSNHQYFGFVTGLTTPKKKELSMSQLLFDNNLQLVWKHDYPINSLRDIAVGNDGTIATLGYTSEESCTRFIFGNITAQDGRQFDAQYNFFVNPITASLIDYRNGLYIMGGIINAADSPSDDECYDRYFGLVYNSRTEIFSGKANTFTLEEVNVLGDKESDKRQKHLYADNLILNCEQPTPYGGALTIQRKYTVIERDANGISSTFHCQTGLLSFGLDTNGNLLWHCPIRSNMVSNDISYSTCETFVDGDHYYVLHSESKKAPTSYDNSEPMKIVNFIKGAPRLACYDIAPDGNVSKKLFELEDNGGVARNVRKLGDKYYGILSRLSKSTLYSLEIK